MSAAAEQIASLVEAIERHPDSPLKEQARAIVAAVLELHREGLERIVTGLREGGPEGRRLLDALSAEPLVLSLLALHELGELPEAPASGGDFVDASRLVSGVRR